MESVELSLSEKQVQFNAAMRRYQTLARYQVFNRAVSLANVSLQAALLLRVWPLGIGPLAQLGAFLAAYLLADLLNGLVHMMMDNNDRYDAFYGPWVANFHLHHKVMQYQKRPLPVVYFNETGSKVWLVGYLAVLLALLEADLVHPFAAHLLVYLGILSSCAEVSHYLAHNSAAPLTLFLGRLRVILPKRHHARHHQQDNRNYAFLNGVSDPLLNLVAAALYPGYKNTTDTHYAHYNVDSAAGYR